MSNVKIVGSINLAKLSNVGIMNVKGKTGKEKKCVVIPIEDNDIYINIKENTAMDGTKYTSRIFALGCEIYEKREADQYGNTHYAKCSVSKNYIDSHSQEDVDARNKIYLGDFKPVEIPSSNQAASVPASGVEASASDDLPF